MIARKSWIEPVANAPQACEVLERIYNYGRKNKVYIEAGYKKALDEKKTKMWKYIGDTK